VTAKPESWKSIFPKPRARAAERFAWQKRQNLICSVKTRLIYANRALYSRAAFTRGFEKADFCVIHPLQMKQLT
jgi:hypothetical protein